MPGSNFSYAIDGKTMQAPCDDTKLCDSGLRPYSIVTVVRQSSSCHLLGGMSSKVGVEDISDNGSGVVDSVEWSAKELGILEDGQEQALLGNGANKESNIGDL